MSAPDLGAVARELCDVFVGWRLREDEVALLALGEGTLRVDLRSGESWCDGEPLPPLFIAGELQRRLEEALAGVPPLREAQLEAVFATRAPGLTGPRLATLQISCACVLTDAAGPHRAESQRGG